WPVNSMPPLALKTSLICSAVRLSAFCICTCTQPLHAYPTSSSFRIILYWNQARFQDHLVLDNSLFARACGEQDNGRAGENRVITHGSRQAESIEMRHHDV